MKRAERMIVDFLRTAPTRRLVAVLMSVTIAAAASAAIALAASAGGPVPRPEPLADAIHQALGAPAVRGISADITFTNHLIGASSLQTSDPLLLGASGRLWFSPAEHALRLELQSNNGDAQLLVRAGSFWLSDPSSNTVYEGTLPSAWRAGGDGTGRAGGARIHGRAQVPSVAAISRLLGRLARHLDLSGAIPTDTGGQPTYTVRISPRQHRGLLSAVALAFDAARGVPLDFAVYAAGDPTPVLALQATSVSFGPVPSSVFAISPPAGARVVRIAPPPARLSAGNGKIMRGLAAVRGSLSFPLAAPARLAGRRRTGVSAVRFRRASGALVSYGRGLDAIAVIEAPAGGRSAATAGLAAGFGSHGGAGSVDGVPLPSVSIDGVRGRELQTALGTVISFARAGVDYTVMGSVRPAVALAAARGL